MTQRPKVAVIGTGGTISSVGKGPLDLQDYGANDTMLHVDELLARFPETNEVADVHPVRFRAIPSPAMFFAEWRDLVLMIDELASGPDAVDGVVVTHGTASLEETAYMLHLTVKAPIPVVVVGAQRPASALSSDAGLNLVNAIRVAGAIEARGLGVLTLLNDEIQCARDVTKTSTYRQQTFKSPDFGALGHADGDAIVIYRQPVRAHAPETEFDLREMDGLPRVDVAYAYCGADGTAVRAFVEAGARGIVSAGFAPGFSAPGDVEALDAAVARGVVVVQCTRAGSGRTFESTKLEQKGYLTSDNLNPQKARLLLSLALAVTDDAGEIRRIFRTY